MRKINGTDLERAVSRALVAQDGANSPSELCGGLALVRPLLVELAAVAVARVPWWGRFLVNGAMIALMGALDLWASEHCGPATLEASNG